MSIDPTFACSCFGRGTPFFASPGRRSALWRAIELARTRFGQRTSPHEPLTISSIEDARVLSALAHSSRSALSSPTTPQRPRTTTAPSAGRPPWPATLNAGEAPATGSRALTAWRLSSRRCASPPGASRRSSHSGPHLPSPSDQRSCRSRVIRPSCGEGGHGSRRNR